MQTPARSVLLGLVALALCAVLAQAAQCPVPPGNPPPKAVCGE